MKKKIIVAVVGIICLLSMLLVGCSNINVQDVDTDIIKVLQEAIAESEKYDTYYIRERYDTDPKNMAQNERTEYMLNVQADDKSINGVDNAKINFSIKNTKGITEYTDTFIIGNSLSKNVKAKSAKPDDYKLYVFQNYKISKTAPVFTRTCEPIEKANVFTYRTPTGVKLNDYTMAEALRPLAELTKDDIKMAEKAGKKQGKVTTFTFEVINEGHEYANKGKLNVLLYTDKKITRVMQVASVDESYTLDVMYQGPKIDIASYDNYSESDNAITLTSNRSDGLVELFTKDPADDEIMFEQTINPVELADKEVVVGEGENKITYKYEITTIESAVNWNYEYTEVIIRLIGVDKDGNKVELADINENQYLEDVDGKIVPKHYFIKTINIVKEKKDMSSMIPMAAAIVALVALVLALLALIKIKKQNKALKAQIKALNGEGTEEEEVIIDAEVVETAEQADETAPAEDSEQATETTAVEEDNEDIANKQDK